MADITENWWFQLINIPILILIFLILNEFGFRRCPALSLWLSIIAFVSIPIYATLIQMDWIQFITLIFLCLAALFATLYRYSHHSTQYLQSKLFANLNIHKWSILHFKFTPLAPYIIYILCILDLVLTAIKELLNSFHWNAIAALFLCFTFPIPSIKIDPSLWSISPMNKEMNQRNDLIVKCNIGWIVSYTTFASCYIYSNYFEGFVRGIALLLIPLIDVLFHSQYGTDLWVQTRLYTLWFYYVFKVVSLGHLNKYMYCTDNWRLISDQHHRELLQFWGLINAVLSVLQFLYWVFHLTKMKTAVRDLNMIQRQMVYEQNNQRKLDHEESEPLSTPRD